MHESKKNYAQNRSHLWLPNWVTSAPDRIFPGSPTKSSGSARVLPPDLAVGGVASLIHPTLLKSATEN